MNTSTNPVIGQIEKLVDGVPGYFCWPIRPTQRGTFWSLDRGAGDLHRLWPLRHP